MALAIMLAGVPLATAAAVPVTGARMTCAPAAAGPMTTGMTCVDCCMIVAEPAVTAITRWPAAHRYVEIDPIAAGTEPATTHPPPRA